MERNIGKWMDGKWNLFKIDNMQNFMSYICNLQASGRLWICEAHNE